MWLKSALPLQSLHVSKWTSGVYLLKTIGFRKVPVWRRATLSPALWYTYCEPEDRSSFYNVALYRNISPFFQVFANPVHSIGSACKPSSHVMHGFVSRERGVISHPYQLHTISVLAFFSANWWRFFICGLVKGF